MQLRLSRADKYQLADTAIANILITEYLAQLTGNELKLYLYLQFVMQHLSQQPELSWYADLLGVKENDVVALLDNLTAKGLLVQASDKDYVLLDLKYQSVENMSQDIVQARDTLSPISTDKVVKLKQLINDQFFLGIMPTGVNRLLDEMIYRYHFSDDLIYSFFSYYRQEQGISNVLRLTELASDLAAKHLTTAKQFDSYLENQEAFKQIYRYLGTPTFRFRLTAIQEEAVQEWFLAFFPDGKVKKHVKAFKQIVHELAENMSWRGNITFGAVDKQIREYIALGLLNVEQIKEYEAKRAASAKATSKKRTSAKTSIDNFNARTVNTEQLRKQSHDTIKSLFADEEE